MITIKDIIQTLQENSRKTKIDEIDGYDVYKYVVTIDEVVTLLNAFNEQNMETKYEYAIRRSIMRNSNSLNSVRELLSHGYKIIDKSILNVGDGGEDYIEYVFSREVKEK